MVAVRSVLEDDTGSMELIAFQRVIDAGGSYLKENEAVYCAGRISVRDEKDPQLMLDTVGPLASLRSEEAIEITRASISSARSGRSRPAPEAEKPKTLWVKLPTRDDPAFHSIELILTMFPGAEPMVVYFEDTKKRLGARCIIHPALVEELTEMLGAKNVIVK